MTVFSRKTKQGTDLFQTQRANLAQQNLFVNVVNKQMCAYALVIETNIFSVGDRGAGCLWT